MSSNTMNKQQIVENLQKLIDRDVQYVKKEERFKKRFIAAKKDSEKIEERSKICHSMYEDILSNRKIFKDNENQLEDIIKKLNIDLESLNENIKNITNKIDSIHIEDVSENMQDLNDIKDLKYQTSLKFRTIKEMLNLYVDAKAPPNILQGFSINKWTNTLHPFQCDKKAFPCKCQLKNKVWSFVAKTSPYYDEWDRLFCDTNTKDSAE